MYLTLVRPRKVWTLNSEEDTGLLKLFTLLTLMLGHMTHVIKNYPGIIQHIEIATRRTNVNYWLY